MRLWDTIGYSGAARSRRHLFTLGGASLLLVITGGGSAAWAMHSSEGSRAGSSAHSSAVKVVIDAKQSSVSPGVSSSADQLPHSDVTDTPTDRSTTSQDVTSPDVTNTNSSSTNITVNGQTTHITGGASFNTSYLSDDGTTRVDLSVHGSSLSSGNKTKEDDMD